MADRIIKDCCKTSSTLAQLSHGAERLFWRLTTIADNMGRFHAEVSAVLAAAFPVMLDRIKLREVAGWLGELREVGLIVCYEADGRVYASFAKWGKHQRLYHYKSKLPEPPGTSGNLRDSPLEIESRSELELESRSEKVKIKTTRAKTALVYPEDFLAFWEAYPRRIGKGAALKAWVKVNGHGTDIMAALEWQTKSRDYLDKDRQYIPHPATWLNQRRWEDPKPPESEGW